MKINKHIEVVRSNTPRLSSLGLKSCQMIQELLSRHYSRVGITYVNNEVDLASLIEKSPDLVFLGFKNMPSTTPGESKTSHDIWICEELDNNDIPYTGSDRGAMLLDHNKAAAKRVILEANLPTAPYFVASSDSYRSEKELPLNLPLFVKPPEGGGGAGIDDNSVIRDFAAYKRKIAAIERDFGTPAIVEKYLTGREFSVAILDSNSGGLLAMPIELISDPNERGDQILSRKVKSEDTEHVIGVPSGALRSSLIALAEDVFEAIGARDYGRIDIRMGADKKLYFLEANLIPGVAMHDFTSYFTSACWIDQKIDYETMLLSIVSPGIRRGLAQNAKTYFDKAELENLLPTYEVI